MLICCILKVSASLLCTPWLHFGSNKGKTFTPFFVLNSIIPTTKPQQVFVYPNATFCPTLWAIKLFNALNTVYKNPYCIWIYSLNCNTLSEAGSRSGLRQGNGGGRGEGCRMRKCVHALCMCAHLSTHEVDMTVARKGIRAYKLCIHTLYSTAHCSLSSGLSSLLNPARRFELWIVAVGELIACCFAAPGRSR